MSSITIIENELKKYEGTTFNSFADMCQALVLINGKPCAKGTPIGSYRKTIERELQSYAEISIQQKIKGGNKLITIEKVFAKQHAVSSLGAGEANITEYLRPILWEMINNEYQDVSFIKYHKDLTVQLKYLGADYIKLYNALFNETFYFKGIQNNDNFTRHIISKFVGKIISYITYNCENLNYNGVSTDKIPIIDKANYECLSFGDQQLYDKFKQDAKNEIDKEKEPIKEIIPDITIDYRSIPQRAAKKFNDYKKLLDINYVPIELGEAWTFEIDGNFKLSRRLQILKY